MIQQATRSPDLAYSAVDSPAGQLAWIAEKFKEWTERRPTPEDAVAPRPDAHQHHAVLGDL